MILIFCFVDYRLQIFALRVYVLSVNRNVTSLNGLYFYTCLKNYTEVNIHLGTLAVALIRFNSV